MKNMRKKLLISCTMLLFLFGLYCTSFYNKQYKIIENNKKTNSVINSSSLTFMFETEYQSGEYQVSSDSSWSQDGYIFNEELSSCEKGSILTWDDENKKVIMQANTSDKCYVYFDAYEPLLIISHSLGLGNGYGNYLGEITTNREVEIEKYVLELDSGLILETTSDRWPDGCEAGYGMNTKYSYTFYIITVDGEVSEPVFGTLTTDNEICGPVVYP